MRSSLLLKIATLTLFILLISGFVAYRAGALEGFFAQAPADDPAAPALDSPRDSMQQREFMHSSKSGRMFVKPEDTSRKPIKRKPDSVSWIDPGTMMNSSKSGAIFIPEKKDTPEKVEKIPVHMGSSKSAPVFTPKKDTSKKTEQQKQQTQQAPVNQYQSAPNAPANQGNQPNRPK